MALKSIKVDRPRLADIVYQQLLEAISKGEIGQEEHLVQEKLAEQMQISRTPVREALLRLEQDGILTTTSRGGFRLHQPSNSEVKELYQVRAAIEGQASRILAVHHDDTILHALRKTIDTEENITSDEVGVYFQANRTIHRRFVELADNRYLVEMFDNLWNRAVSYNLFASLAKIDICKSLGNHHSLVDAIETGDVTIAHEAIVKHIAEGFEMQIEALES